jgi:uncharacterized membrane protein
MSKFHRKNKITNKKDKRLIIILVVAIVALIAFLIAVT